MLPSTIAHNHAPAFNEEEWLKLLFLLNDTQSWLNELISTAFLQIPVPDKKRLFRKTYYLTVSSLAHILEKHYYKIQRHPGSGKFTVPVTDIISYLRDASCLPTVQIAGTLNFERTMDAERIIGFDRSGHQTDIITIITGHGGHIITAFPGSTKH